MSINVFALLSKAHHLTRHIYVLLPVIVESIRVFALLITSQYGKGLAYSVRKEKLMIDENDEETSSG
jgi:hypothetical protein